MFYYLERSISGLKILGYVDSGYAEQFSQVVLPTPLNYLDTVLVNNIFFQYEDTIGIPSVLLVFQDHISLIL